MTQAWLIHSCRSYMHAYPSFSMCQASCKQYTSSCLSVLHAYAGWQRAHATQAFPWNESTRGSTAQRAGQQPAALDVLCPICSSPLTDAEIQEACQSAVRCLHFCLQQHVLARYVNGSYMHWQSAWQSVLCLLLTFVCGTMPSIVCHYVHVDMLCELTHSFVSSACCQ